MRKTLIEVAAAITLTLGIILTLASDASAGSVMVMKAYARASATPTAQAGAAYVSLMIHGPADRLIAVSTPAASMAGLHKTVLADGVMEMQHVDAIDIPADGLLEMKPGGYHIMLMGLRQPLKAGDEIDLVLTFETAGEVKVKAKVGGVAAGSAD